MPASALASSWLDRAPVQWSWTAYDLVLALGLMLPVWPAAWRLLGLVTIFGYFELALYDALVFGRWLNSWLGTVWINPNVPWALALGHGLVLLWLLRYKPPSAMPVASSGTSPLPLASAGPEADV
ncbi:hypothetical protein HRbin36_00531 [bacterium HR36]|nr:hypothetical protein HRbin36_00531 [bacterium HR36]